MAFAGDGGVGAVGGTDVRHVGGGVHALGFAALLISSKLGEGVDGHHGDGDEQDGSDGGFLHSKIFCVINIFKLIIITFTLGYGLSSILVRIMCNLENSNFVILEFCIFVNKKM